MPTLASREYKLMLRASKFKGDESQVNAAAGELWQDLAAIIIPNAVAVSGTDDIRHKRRQVRFFDTGDKWLRGNDYVVRERIDLDSNERQLTLKFRHPDRFVSQDRSMDPHKDYAVDMKFEEDIKPAYIALYSYSSNILVKDDVAIDTLQGIGKLYPGLEQAVDNWPLEEQKLLHVGNFTAYEQVIKGTSFQIRKNPEIAAVCSLTLWYASEEDQTPVVAEFSFKYEDEKENYSGKMARRAYDSFHAIQANLKPWIDDKSMTKTAYVYALQK
jgi:hypothetical protein